MTIIDLWQEIWQTTKRKPSRTILTGIGIAWGIFILIILVGVGEGFRGGVMSLFSGFTQKTTDVYAGNTSKNYRGTPMYTSMLFTDDDIEMLKSNIAEIEYISPYVSNYKRVARLYKTSYNSVVGIHPDYFRLRKPEVQEGRLLNNNDYGEKRKVVVIGKEVKRALFDDTNPIGENVVIDGNIYMVVGVVKNSLLSSGEDRNIYMPYSTYTLTSNEDRGFTRLSYSIASTSNTKTVNQQARNHLSRFHCVAPDDYNAFYFSSLDEQIEAFDSLFDGLSNFLWFLGLATLFSGVLGVANMMYTSAKERTREIGIRKAIGARPSTIKNMFVCESIVLTTISGYVGIFFGWLVLIAIGHFVPDDSEVFMKPSIDLPIALTATLVLIVAGTVSGLRPAIYASQLNPIEALKEEN